MVGGGFGFSPPLQHPQRSTTRSTSVSGWSFVVDSGSTTREKAKRFANMEDNFDSAKSESASCSSVVSKNWEKSQNVLIPSVLRSDPVYEPSVNRVSVR